jgi:hypothetical protein
MMDARPLAPQQAAAVLGAAAPLGNPLRRDATAWLIDCCRLPPAPWDPDESLAVDHLMQAEEGGR